jgi:GT2 family glycosyltransferase
MLTYSAVIPTMNRPQRATAAVQSVLEQSRLPEQIVLVDASTPPFEAPAELQRRTREAGVELVVTHAEPSTAHQRNLGVDLVDTPTVLLLDDDVYLEPAYADVLLRRWEEEGLSAFGAIVGSPEVVHWQRPVARFLRRLFMLHYHDPKGEATSFRRSRKLRMVARPAHEVYIPAVGAGGPIFRTDLLRKHRFDEHFPGYAPGEDLDMSARLATEARILQTPAVRFTHEWDPHQRQSRLRWHYRGRRETYFRLRHLERSPLSAAAFGLSVAAEAALAALDSVRERDASHVKGYVGGVRETLREARRQRRSQRERSTAPL